MPEAAFDVPGEDDPAAVEACAELARELGAPWVSGHLWPSRGEVQGMGRRAQELQDRLGLPFLVEVAEYDSPGVVAEVVERCDCGLVLNLALLARADSAAFLRLVPLERVVEVHLTTGDGDGVEVHSEPVAAEVWELFAGMAADVRASVVERDGGGRPRSPRTLSVPGRCWGHETPRAGRAPSRHTALVEFLARRHGWLGDVISVEVEGKPVVVCCGDDGPSAWAADAGLDWGDVERGLRSQAAFCDYEVLTVDPDASN